MTYGQFIKGVKDLVCINFLVFFFIFVIGIIMWGGYEADKKEAQQSCVCQETADFDLNTMVRGNE